MSKRHRSHSTYVLIRTGDGYLLELLTLVKLYRDQVLYAYKLFLNHTEFRKLDNASIDGATGTILNPGKPGDKIISGLEITYHRDGKVMFKDITSGRNFIREKHISMEYLKKPKIFFQVGGLPLKDLPNIDAKSLLINVPQIILNDYKIKDYINCDFYISSIRSKAEISIPEHSQHIFQKPFWFSLEDDKNGIMLYIFIWQPKGIQKYTYLNIPSRNLSHKMRQIIDTIRLGNGRLMMKDWWVQTKSWFYKKTERIR